ncbi:MAG: hypothetical protein HYR97_03050 [Candidatus Melainabacteria bacterium]|nr:hypothetical protein [Candidatus Melainabacteria bacterium]
MFDLSNLVSTVFHKQEVYEFIVSLIVLSSIIMTGSRRLETIIKLFALQSLGLVIVILISGIARHSHETYMISGITLLGKCILIPWVLSLVLNKVKIRREVETYVALPASMLICCGVAVFVFYITTSYKIASEVMSSSLLSASVSMILIGLFIMMTRKKALTQILGLYVMENGIFALSIDTIYDMPLVVEMGIFLDLLIGAMVMGIYVYRIKQSFDTINVEEMQELKG